MGSRHSRRWRLALLAVGLLALTACGSAGGAGGGGRPVPDLELESFDGGTTSLASYEGRPLIVNFWASWCGPCVAEVPDFERAHQAVGGQVAFLGIDTQDAPKNAAKLVKETGVTYDLVRDPEARAFEAFGVIGMPTTYFVDAGGRILAQHTGALTFEAIVERIEEHFGIVVAGADA